MREVIAVLAGFIGSLGFGMLFNIKGKRLVTAAVGGAISWIFYLLLGAIVADEAVRYFIVSVGMSVYCEIMARRLKTPTTTFLMTSLIPLIPGRDLYYTMTNAFSGDFLGFMERGLTTLSLSVALALGVIVVTVFFNVFNSRKVSKCQ